MTFLICARSFKFSDSFGSSTMASLTENINETWDDYPHKNLFQPKGTFWIGMANSYFFKSVGTVEKKMKIVRR